MHPDSEDVDRAGPLVDDDPGIAAAVELGGKTAEVAHVDDRPHRLPRAAAVGAAGEADVDVFLEVTGRTVPEVVGRQERAGRRRRQHRDPRRVDAVVALPAKGDPDALADVGRRIGDDDPPGRCLQRRARDRDPVDEIGLRGKASDTPEDVVTGSQRGVDRERDRAGGGDVGGQRCPPGDGSERLVASRRHHRKRRQSGDPIGSQQRQRHPLDPRAGPLPLDVHHHPAQRQALVAKQQRHHRPGHRRRDRLPGNRATDHDNAHEGKEPAQQHRMGGHGADHFAEPERSRMKMFRQRISPPWVWSWIGPFSGTDTARS